MAMFERGSQGAPDPLSSSRSRTLKSGPMARRTSVISAVVVVIAAGVLSLGVSQVPAGAATSTLSGTVLESDGTTPAADTNVQVQQQNSPNGTFTTTDSSGLYGIDVADGTWVITAQPPNGDSADAATSITVVVSGGAITSGPNPPDITLQVANLSGTVSESNGTTPAADTNVQVQQQNSPNGTGTNTDMNGHYGVHVADGTWVITAQPPNGDSTDAATSITVVVSGGVITSGPNPPDITLQVANLTGTVVESNGTTPAADTNVQVQQQNSPNGTCTNTDMNGHYGVHVADGTWIITAQPPNGDSTDAATSITVVVSGGVITSGPNPPDITLQVANLTGTVVESNGTTPAADTNVQVQQQNSPNGTFTNTDMNGHYGVHVADGTWIVTAGPPNGDTTDAATSITVVVSGGVITSINGSPSSGPADVTLQTANLTGTVVESNGTTPAADTNVQVQQQNSPNGTGTGTDMNGHYGVHVADGTWVVTAGPPTGDTTDAPTSITVVVSGGVITSINGSPSSGPANITLQVANLTGTVVESNGTTPAANTGVSAQEQGSFTQPIGTNTDVNGHYGVHVADGTWVITAQPPNGDTTDATTSITVVVSGGVITSINGNPSSGPANITLQVANLTGTVFESNGTTPATNTNVQVQQQNSPNGTFTNTDMNGHYGVHVADGTWIVTATPPNGDTTDATTSITVVVSGGVITSINGSPSSGPADVTLQVANLTGTVVESNGTTPAANTNVQVQQQNSPNGTFTNTDMNGHYGVHVADGTWIVTATPPNGDTTDATTSITVVVSGGVITSINGSPSSGPADVTLQVANLTGTVVESNGTTPATNTNVQVQEQNSPNGTFTNTDMNGHYGVHVADGTWIVTAGPPNGDTTDAPTSITVVVSGGVITSINGSPSSGPADVTLQVANLTGTVFESNGTTPATNTNVQVQEQNSPNGTFTNTDMNGHYGVHVADGTWIVTAGPPNGDTTDAPTSITVVVSGGVITSINGSPSSGPADVTLNQKTPTSFSITVNAGSSVTVSPGTAATLAESGLPGPATGTVVFSSTGNPDLCTITLPATNCDTSTTLPAASYSPITATFFDTDGSYLGSTSTNSVSLTVSKLTPTTPSISNLPASGTDGGGFTAAVSTTGDGATSVTSNSTGVCTVSGSVVSYAGVGTCSLTAHVAAGTDYLGADGTAQTFSVLPSVPPPPAGSTSSASAVSDSPTGSATATNVQTTVTGNGVGGLTVAQFASNPGPSPSFQASGEYFDVSLSAGSSFSSVTVTDCNLSGATTLQWLDGAAWVPVVGAPGPTYSPGSPACLSVTLNSSTSPSLSQLTGTVFAGVSGAPGYRLVASDGGVFAYGDAGFYGSTGALTLNRPIVGMATTQDGKGYWLVASDGGVFAYGDAGFYGSTGALTLNKPIVGMATTQDGKGYWLVASDGGVFAYGDAGFYGSTGALTLNRPIVGMATTQDGKGYWLVASDGGVFAYGDAGFYGSTGALTLNRPIVGMATTQDGKGYWLVASDGGVFAYGDAGFYGSTGALTLNKPIVGMATTQDGKGYWLVASDGGVFAYGDAGFYGSTGALTLNKPIVGMAGQ